MVHFEKWKKILVIITCCFGIFYAAPNLLPSKLVAGLPDIFPSKTVNLGLDLQGGSHLLIEVDVNSVKNERLEAYVDSARKELRKVKIKYKQLAHRRDSLTFTLINMEDRKKAYKIARGLDDNLEVETHDDGRVTAKMGIVALTELQKQVVGQSIETIRRRIDATGTKEPIIQRQGLDRILLQLPGVDNPEEIKKLLHVTAKMSFHLADMETPLAEAMAGNMPGGSKLLPFADTPSQKIVIRKRAIISGDMLIDSSPTFDRNKPVVSFKFNKLGGRRFCDVTRKNIGRPFAIVLDKSVISAPTIQSAICGGQGIITGSFTVKEASELSVLIRSGALPAPLSFIEERSVGPSLGADSVAAGKIASLVGMTLILLFMGASYNRFGIFANIALLVNVALIFAVLSVLQATLTLPGIAGIVLTIGMAVDANVLIFERIREEVKNGRSGISAVDSGYRLALSTIIDANITTLIAAILLYSFGTGPIKGFAVTLGIGILTSMFSAIMFTRMLVVMWLDKNKSKKLPV